MKALANPYPQTPAMAAGLSDHVWYVKVREFARSPGPSDRGGTTGIATALSLPCSLDRPGEWRNFGSDDVADHASVSARPSLRAWVQEPGVEMREVVLDPNVLLERGSTFLFTGIPQLFIARVRCSRRIGKLSVAEDLGQVRFVA